MENNSSNIYFNFKKIEVITVAKTGSSNFLASCILKYPTNHTHSLLHLKNVINNYRDTLIIVGIRNPIDRNLSYLFQTFNNNFYNSVKTKVNNYKGELCYIKELNLKKINSVNSINNYDYNNIDVDKLIELYFNMNYHNTFNEWFYEFFELTKINNKKFNREKGLDFFKLNNNNTIMLYTLEKLNDNQNEICKILNIESLIHSNNSNERDYIDIYNKTKMKIEYTKEYLDNLLNTDIMNFFYTKEDIEKMYSKYKIKS